MDHRSSGWLVRGVEYRSRDGAEVWIRYPKTDLDVVLAINSDPNVFLLELLQIRGVGSTVTHWGPLYVFRNVHNRSRAWYTRTLDADDRNNAYKSGQAGGYGGGPARIPCTAR